jgi:O-Antigen ligase
MPLPKGQPSQMQREALGNDHFDWHKKKVSVRDMDNLSTGPGTSSSRMSFARLEQVRKIGEGKPQALNQPQWPYFLVLLSLLFEFGRPQEAIPGLGAIPFPTMIDALIFLAVLGSGKMSFANTQTKLWLPLLVLMAIHVPIAVNNYWALMTLKSMVLLFSLYLGIIIFVNSWARIQTLVTVWLGVHVVLAVMGIMNEGRGVGGWLGDENDFCMEMNMVVPFAFFMFQMPTKRTKKIVYMSMLGLFVLTAMVTLSRGGFIGLAAVGLYCWLRSSQKIRAVLVVGILVIFMLLLAPAKYWEEVGSITDDKTIDTGTGAERFYTWGIGLDMFLSNPIIGVGQENFPWTLQKYEGEKRFNTRSFAGRAAHSMYFQLFPELGLVGAGILGAMLYYTRRDLRRVDRFSRSYREASGTSEEESAQIRSAFYYARAMEASMIGYLVSSVFISTLYYPSFWVLMAFSIALRNVILGDKTVPMLKWSPVVRQPQSLFRPLGPHPVRGLSSPDIPGLKNQ